MARRGWGRSLIVALLTAAGAAAAQLGLGYGLGIIAWTARTEAATSTGAWSSALAWTTWIAATSVVAGAITGDRLAGPHPGGWFSRVLWRAALALAATLGSLVTLPLVAVPAHSAQIADNYAPHLLAAVYAAIGVVLGLVVAIIAIAARPAAANVLASAAWLWVLAVVAVVNGHGGAEGIGYAELAVWKFTDVGPRWHAYYIPGALVMLGSALLIGGLAAFPAAGRGANRFGVAVSGAMGPLLVAVAYLLSAPDADAPFEQISAYHVSPYMVVAGFAGSLLVAVMGGVPARPSRVEPSPYRAGSAT